MCLAASFIGGGLILENEGLGFGVKGFRVLGLGFIYTLIGINRSAGSVTPPPPPPILGFLSSPRMSVISGIPVAIGGTDLNPAVFYGDWVITISDELTKSLALEDFASYSGSGRLLKKNDPTKYFCKGDHLMANPQEPAWAFRA